MQTIEIDTSKVRGYRKRVREFKKNTKGFKSSEAKITIKDNE